MNTWPRIATVTLNPAIDLTVSVPNFRAGQVNRAQFSQADPGGKGVNVASWLADYGFPVAVTGFLGVENDLIFRRLFEQKRIDDRFVRIAGSTRTGIKVVDPTTQSTTDINFPGQPPSEAELAQLAVIIEELATNCDWLVFSGSIPAGAPLTAYCDLIEQVGGKNVLLDTSGEPFRQAMAATPTIIKPNLDELSEYLGRPLESEAAILAAAHEFLQRGVRTVVVSMGKQGALFVETGEAVHAAPPHVVVKSTVGAGDAMVAGIVAGKSRGLSLAECARLATAFSLDAITHVGSGMSSPEAVAAFIEQVAVRTVQPEGGSLDRHA
jgi:1-phosphofructokinase family hexose kinase